MSNDVNIKNKKAGFEYELISKFTAGIQLLGTEIKSIRGSKASISEAYCMFIKNELWIRNMDISEYSHGNIHNHETKRDRKLLLTQQELDKLRKKVGKKGLSIIPTRLFISKRGFAKVDIAVGRGKKMHDKRDSIKQKDAKKAMDRAMKS